MLIKIALQIIVMGIEIYVTAESIRVGATELPFKLLEGTYQLYRFREGQKSSFVRKEADKLARLAGFTSKVPYSLRETDDYIIYCECPPGLLDEGLTEKKLMALSPLKELGRIKRADIKIPSYAKVLELMVHLRDNLLPFPGQYTDQQRQDWLKGLHQSESQLESLAKRVNEVAPPGVYAEHGITSDVHSLSLGGFVEIFCTAEHNIVVRL